MRINLSFLQNMRGTSPALKLSPFASGSYAKRELKSNQEFKQRLDTLQLSANARQATDVRKSPSIIVLDSPTITELTPEQREAFAGKKLSDYRDRIENAADNLDFYKESISYLQKKVTETEKTAAGELTDEQTKELESWQEKLSPEKFEQFQKDYKEFLVKDAAVKLETYSGTLAKYKDDVKDILGLHMDTANGFVNISKNMYDNKTWEMLQSVIGDFTAETTGNTYGLKGSESSTEDVLASIDDAIRQLKELSGKVSDRYQDFTGDTLPNYTSSGPAHPDPSSAVENTLIFNRTLGDNFDPRLDIALGRTVNIYG